MQEIVSDDIAMERQTDKNSLRLSDGVQQMFNIKHNVCSYKSKVHLILSRSQTPLFDCEGEENGNAVQQLSEST